MTERIVAKQWRQNGASREHITLDGFSLHVQVAAKHIKHGVNSVIGGGKRKPN